jgi:hypothetical protein
MAAKLKESTTPPLLKLKRKTFKRVEELCESPPKATPELKAFFAKGKAMTISK